MLEPANWSHKTSKCVLEYECFKLVTIVLLDISLFDIACRGVMTYQQKWREVWWSQSLLVKFVQTCWFVFPSGPMQRRMLLPLVEIGKKKWIELSSHSLAFKDDDNYYSWWGLCEICYIGFTSTLWVTEQKDFTINFLIYKEIEFFCNLRNWKTNYWKVESNKSSWKIM